jgi:hypothetical protein
MGTVSVTRSVVVVLAAMLLLGFIDQTLEQTLVMALANAPVKDEASYIAVRNRPQVLAALVATHAIAALLTGYVLAKLAGSHEVQHAAATAALVTLLLVAASMAPNVLVPPLWVRVAMGVVTPPALIAGAYIRGQARVIRAARGE